MSNIFSKTAGSPINIPALMKKAGARKLNVTTLILDKTSGYFCILLAKTRPSTNAPNTA